MTVLVTGGRGRVAGAVLDGLIAAGVPADDLRAAGSKPEALAPPAGVTPVRVDLTDPSTLVATLDDVDRVFLYASPDGVDGVADAIRAAGVEQVVVLSSLAAEEDSGALGDHHRIVEDAIAARGLALTALRPGSFATNALGWAESIRASGTVRTPYPGCQTTPIHEQDLADVAVAALTGPVGTLDGAFPLSGPQSMSFADQVDVLSHELGRDIELVELTPEQGREQFGGAPPPLVDTIMSLWAASDGVPQPTHPVERITGRPGRTFAEWAHDNRGAFVV